MVDRLREITNENIQECVFKDFGLWKPEILNEVSDISNKRHAIYIEFLPIAWKAPCDGVQNGNVQIRLHIMRIRLFTCMAVCMRKGDMSAF